MGNGQDRWAQLPRELDQLVWVYFETHVLPHCTDCIDPEFVRPQRLWGEPNMFWDDSGQVWDATIPVAPTDFRRLIPLDRRQAALDAVRQRIKGKARPPLVTPATIRAKVMP
jgi:hypothetical protein